MYPLIFLLSVTAVSAAPQLLPPFLNVTTLSRTPAPHATAAQSNNSRYRGHPFTVKEYTTRDDLTVTATATSPSHRSSHTTSSVQPNITGWKDVSVNGTAGEDGQPLFADNADLKAYSGHLTFNGTEFDPVKPSWVALALAISKMGGLRDTMKEDATDVLDRYHLQNKMVMAVENAKHNPRRYGISPAEKDDFIWPRQNLTGYLFFRGHYFEPCSREEYEAAVAEPNIFDEKRVEVLYRYTLQSLLQRYAAFRGLDEVAESSRTALDARDMDTIPTHWNPWHTRLALEKMSISASTATSTSQISASTAVSGSETPDWWPMGVLPPLWPASEDVPREHQPTPRVVSVPMSMYPRPTKISFSSSKEASTLSTSTKPKVLSIPLHPRPTQKSSSSSSRSAPPSSSPTLAAHKQPQCLDLTSIATAAPQL